MTSPKADLIDAWTETAKDLLQKWSAYGSEVTTKLGSRSYDADELSADLGTAVSLAVETGARLSIEALNLVSVLTDDQNPETVDSSTRWKDQSSTPPTPY